MEMVKLNRLKFIDILGFSLTIIVLSYYLGNLIKTYTSKTDIVIKDKKEEKRPSQKLIQDYATVVDRNIFGIKNVNFSIIEKREEVAPTVDTSGFKLKGVITLYPGYAFIENREGKQMLFKRGEDVYSAGKLSLVSNDHVYISQGAKGFTIYLEGVVKEEKKQVTSLQSFLPFPSSPAGAQTFSREQIKRFLEDPKEILTDARLLPNFIDGRQHGFVVREVKPGGFYDGIGLRNGDVILRANNIELTSPNDGIKIFNLLKELDKVELDILRDGSRKTLTFIIN